MLAQELNPSASYWNTQKMQIKERPNENYHRREGS